MEHLGNLNKKRTKAEIHQALLLQFSPQEDFLNGKLPVEI